MTGETCYNNIRDYGAPTWYEWTVSHWGTKWNAYDQNQISDNCVEFLTAWSGVPELIGKLSEMFPSLTLSYMYADEDWGNNLGEYIFEGGQCVDVNVPDYGSPEARSITTELLGEPYWEEDMEEPTGGIEP